MLHLCNRLGGDWWLCLCRLRLCCSALCYVTFWLQTCNIGQTLTSLPEELQSCLQQDAECFTVVNNLLFGLKSIAITSAQRNDKERCWNASATPISAAHKLPLPDTGRKKFPGHTCMLSMVCRNLVGRVWWWGMLQGSQLSPEGCELLPLLRAL